MDSIGMNMKHFVYVETFKIEDSLKIQYYIITNRKHVFEDLKFGVDTFRIPWLFFFFVFEKLKYLF